MQISQQATELAIADLITPHEQRFEELGKESSPLVRLQRSGESGDGVCLGVGERDRHGRIHWRAGARRVDCASCIGVVDDRLRPADLGGPFVCGGTGDCRPRNKITSTGPSLRHPLRAIAKSAPTNRPYPARRLAAMISLASLTQPGV
jgi:hypothetical protein